MASGAGNGVAFYGSGDVAHPGNKVYSGVVARSISFLARTD
jgi:hypothetical protein